MTCVDEIPGIHWPSGPDDFPPPPGWSWVERCDETDLYADDEEAALALRDLLVASGAVRATVRWFERATLRPLNTYKTGASCAIEIPEGQASIIVRRRR